MAKIVHKVFILNLRGATKWIYFFNPKNRIWCHKPEVNAVRHPRMLFWSSSSLLLLLLLLLFLDSPNNQFRSALDIEVMLHSGYFYFLLHFCKWLQKYVIDPVLWIFTGYTTLGGRQKRSKFVDIFEREILPTDSSGKRKLLDRRPFEESAQIVKIWFKAAYCETIGEYFWNNTKRVTDLDWTKWDD